MVKNYSDDWTDNDFDFVVNSAYLESEQIQNFINDVENYIDMSGIKDYDDLRHRLELFFRKKSTNEPYKHQVDIFAEYYGIERGRKETRKPVKEMKREKLEKKRKAKPVPKTYRDERNIERVEVVLIHDRKLNQHFREPVFYEVVTVKGIATNQKREVIHQKHIPWHMVSKGYKYVVRDKQTGRFVKWVK